MRASVAPYAIAAVSALAALAVVTWLAPTGCACPPEPARSLALGPDLTVHAVTPGTTYAHLRIMVDDDAQAWVLRPPAEGEAAARRGEPRLGPHAPVHAGDVLEVPAFRAGRALRVLDAESGSVMLTLGSPT